MNIPHPLPYQGSKRRLAPYLLFYLPKNFKRFIEPFAGSAALSIALAHAGRASNFWLGDLNAPLMVLWQQILDDPQGLATRYQNLWEAQQGQERAFYDEVRTKFNQSARSDYFLYLLARCVKASVRYNAKGEFNQSPDNRRRGMHPATMRQNLEATAKLLAQKTALVSGDYRYLLALANPEDIVYLDPPYQGVSGSGNPRYIEGLNHAEFVKALQDLNSRHIPYLLSYDGKTGDKVYGQILPASLGLERISLEAGPSSQATLLGKNIKTTEYLYLSPVLAKRLNLLQESHLRLAI